MKKTYVKPEVEIIEVEIESNLMKISKPEVGGGAEEPGEWDSREDYSPNRPGNPWDQVW